MSSFDYLPENQLLHAISWTLPSAKSKPYDLKRGRKTVLSLWLLRERKRRSVISGKDEDDAHNNSHALFSFSYTRWQPHFDDCLVWAFQRSTSVCAIPAGRTHLKRWRWLFWPGEGVNENAIQWKEDEEEEGVWYAAHSSEMKSRRIAG